MLRKPEISSGRVGLWLVCAFTFYLYLDWIVLTLVWFERFLHPVKGTWIRMVTYASGANGSMSL